MSADLELAQIRDGKIDGTICQCYSVGRTVSSEVVLALPFF